MLPRPELYDLPYEERMAVIAARFRVFLQSQLKLEILK